MSSHKGRDIIPGQPELLREARGNLSQAELAKRVGTGQGTISALEGGTRAPSARMVWLIAYALGVPVGALFPPREQPRKKSEK
jgi:putative transcriptional regulator